MTVVDVREVIDTRPVSRYQWSIVATCTAIALIDGFDVQAMGVAAPALAREWGVPAGGFGPVFAAAPAGMLVGALAMGRLADRVGRRRPVIAATLLFAIGTALTAFAPTLEMMTAIRFVTGIGLGGVLPNLVSLVTEFAPRRLRGTLTTVTFSSLPFGAMLASLFAHASMESYGWQSLFYVGAILPVLVAGVAACCLPESVHFLTLAGDRQLEIARILRKVAPDLPVERRTTFDAGERRDTPVSFPALVGPGRTRTTVLLVAVVALNMSMLYFTLNWLPLLMNGAGLSHEHALLATVIVNAAGGLGAMAWGLLMDRFGRIRVMVAAGVAAFAGLALLGVGHDRPALLMPALVIVGACIMGALPGLYVVIASVYPTAIRSTGVGAVLGVARIGSVLGPMAGGILIARNWPVPAILIAVGSLGLFWASGLWLMDRGALDDTRAQDGARP
jgi:MFS transporter, AAHS family, 4-hydroxybenzoate transporter